MNTRWRWCISAIIFSLTLFGVVSQQQLYVPNQEIVLRFTKVNLTSNQAQTTLAIVKKQLQDIGVENIRVKEGKNGLLKITYYSDADIASIQKTLSLDYSALNHETSNIPNKDDNVRYNLDVYEIQKADDNYSGLNGKVVLEPKPKNDRTYNHTFDFSFNDISVVSEKENLFKVVYKVSQHISLEIEETLHIIPEVRAGPVS